MAKQKYFWMQWYPDDWLMDSQVALCSLAAQGLWMRMLCWMWKQNPRGVLTGKIDELANLVGRTAQEIAPLVAELEHRGVFSRGSAVGYCRTDAIVNRRMYETWKVTAARAEAGRKGGRMSRKTADQPNMEGEVEARKAAEETIPEDGGDETQNKQTLSKTQANVKQTSSKTPSKPPSKTEANGKQNLRHISSEENDLQRNPVSKTQANAKQTAKQTPKQTASNASNFNFRSRSLSISESVKNAEISTAMEYPTSGILKGESVGTPTCFTASNYQSGGMEIGASGKDAGRFAAGNHPAKKNQPTPIGQIIGADTIGNPAHYRNHLLREIAGLTHDPQDFLEWFGVAIDILCKHGGAGELEGWIQYAKDSQNPRTRTLKGIGEPLKNPGAFLVSRMIAWGRTRRIGLPPLPAKQPKGANYVSNHA